MQATTGKMVSLVEAVITVTMARGAVGETIVAGDIIKETIAKMVPIVNGIIAVLTVVYGTMASAIVGNEQANLQVAEIMVERIHRHQEETDI